jgi:hypothetical protein
MDKAEFVPLATDEENDTQDEIEIRVREHAGRTATVKSAVINLTNTVMTMRI